MPSFDALEPLAPDACRSDPSAPCFYWHTKIHALNGGRDKLSERELTFVGVDTWPIVTPGCARRRGLYLDDSLEAFGLTGEDSAALHAIMSIDSRERLEFLTTAHGRRGHNLGHSRVGSGTLRVPQTCRSVGQGGIGSVEVGRHQDVEEFGAGACGMASS